MQTILDHTEPCSLAAVHNTKPETEPKQLLDLPCRKRSYSPATFYKDDYDTYTNGIILKQESYGIFGYMIVQSEGIKVHSNDYVFVSAEPRNNAPVEFIMVYHRGTPFLAVHDWGSVGHGYHFIAELNEEFVNKWCRLTPTPTGEKVKTLCFQSFYNPEVNANQLVLCDASNTWKLVYQSKTTAYPAPVPDQVEGGWAVLEYKKHKSVSATWAGIPNMLGIMGIQLMDKNENWCSPTGKQAELQESSFLSPKYQQVFTEENVSVAYCNKSI